MILEITDFTEDEWVCVRPQLARAALIRVEPLAGVSYPYIHFHPTLGPYLPTTRFRRAYHQLARQLYFDDRQHPHEARSIAARWR